MDRKYEEYPDLRLQEYEFTGPGKPASASAWTPACTGIANIDKPGHADTPGTVVAALHCFPH